MYYIPVWWHYLRAKREVKQKSRKPLFHKNLRLSSENSGRQDSNLRLLGPKPSALARLSYAPLIFPMQRCWRIRAAVPGLGFEPRLTGSEPVVLPLHHPGIVCPNCQSSKLNLAPGAGYCQIGFLAQFLDRLVVNRHAFPHIAGRALRLRLVPDAPHLH